MTVASAGRRAPTRTEVTVAIIGLVGVLATALLSNLDKIFPRQNLVQATYSGYRPSDDFETELRYYFDVSGARRLYESMWQQLLLNYKADALSKSPEDAAAINRAFAVIDSEPLRVDEVIRELLPVYQRHFTIAELHELNKFYSTNIMQDMAKKIPLLTQEAAPIQLRIVNEYNERIAARLRAELESK